MDKNPIYMRKRGYKTGGPGEWIAIFLEIDGFLGEIQHHSPIYVTFFKNSDTSLLICTSKGLMSHFAT
jgi:hypothetical protein